MVTVEGYVYGACLIFTYAIWYSVSQPIGEGLVSAEDGLVFVQPIKRCTDTFCFSFYIFLRHTLVGKSWNSVNRKLINCLR